MPRLFIADAIRSFPRDVQDDGSGTPFMETGWDEMEELALSASPDFQHFDWQAAGDLFDVWCGF